MPKKGVRFDEYIYRLLIAIKKFSDDEMRTLCEHSYRQEVTNDMYWKLFRKTKEGEYMTPSQAFMPSSYDVMFKHFLEVFDFYDNWEDFVTKETLRWISFGKPDKAGWHKPIEAAIKELSEKYSDKHTPDKSKTAQNLFTKVEKLEKDHEYHKAIMDCQKCIKLNPELLAYTFKLVELYLKQLEPKNAIETLEELEEKLVSKEYQEVLRHNLAISFLEIGSRRKDKIGHSFKAKAVYILKVLYNSQKQNLDFHLDTFLKIACSYINALLAINENPDAIEILKYVIDRATGQLVRKDIKFRIRFYEGLLLKDPENALEKLFWEVKESFLLEGKEEFMAEIAYNLIPKMKADLDKISLLKECFEFPITGHYYSGIQYKAMIALAELSERNEEYDLAKDCYESIIKDPHIDEDLVKFIATKKLGKI